MLLSKLASFWSTHPTLKKIPHIVVGLSGGKDSVALCHALLQSKLVQPSQLTFVYVNHHWRPEAQQEEQFVQDFGQRLGVNVLIKHAKDVSSEDEARQARYLCLAKVAAKAGSTAVLTAHHANDQVETFLLNLLRGSGLTGLKGMKPFSPYPLTEFTDLQLIRPLLAVSRTEIDSYIATNNLTFVMDQSNNDTRYLRNKIRHELLLQLEQYNPNIQEQLGRTAMLLHDDYQIIDELVKEEWEQLHSASGDKWIWLSLPKFLAKGAALQRYLLRFAMEQVCGHTKDLSFEQLLQAQQIIEHGETGKTAELAHNVKITISYDILFVAQDRTFESTLTHPQLATTATTELTPPCDIQLDKGWSLSISPITYDQIDWKAVIKDRHQAIITLPIGSGLALRGRVPGDQFQPFGRNSHKKLKDWFIARKIPAILRDKWPLVINKETNEILWVSGLEISQTAAVQEQNATSQQNFHLQIKQTNKTA